MLVRGRASARAAHLSEQFAQTLSHRSASPAPGELIGVEHEFQVLRNGEQIDFRKIVHRLGLGTSHLDPQDLNAYRTPSGAAITADYREAEIATPPVVLRDGFAAEVVTRAGMARTELEGSLAPGDVLAGYSTHINVSMDQLINDAVARRYAVIFGPALMMLLDRRDSPGLLIRPRPERLELCAEYLDGPRLRAVVAFVVGSVLATTASFGHGSRRLPEPIALRVDPAVERFGWYIDRRAAGVDVCSDRSTPLRCATGPAITAQQHLERCIESAIGVLPVSAPDEVALLEAMARGSVPLPCEGEYTGSDPAAVDVPPSPYARAALTSERVGFGLAPVLVTWRTCVFVVAGPRTARRAFICVPRADLVAFYRSLDAGDLDALLLAYLRGRPDARRLESVEQTSAAGLFDDLGRRRDLVPAERAPERSSLVEAA